MTTFPTVKAQAQIFANNFDDHYSKVIADTTIQSDASSVRLTVEGQIGRAGEMGQWAIPRDSFTIVPGADGKLAIEKQRTIVRGGKPSVQTTSLPFDAENAGHILHGIHLVQGQITEPQAQKLQLLADAIKAALA